MQKNIRFRYLLCTSILFATVILIYQTNPSQFTSVHSTPPARTAVVSLPRVIITPIPIFSVEKVRQVLSNNDFEYYPVKEQFCPTPCKAYNNSQHGIIAQSYDDETLALGIKFESGSKLDGFKQAAVIFTVLKPLYPQEVILWIVDNIGTDSVSYGVISRFYIRIENIATIDNNGVSLIITPIKNIPKDPDS